MENRMLYVSIVRESRPKAPGKHRRSPFSEFSDIDDGSVQRPTSFKRKHPFDSYANFKGAAELIDSFQLWIKQKLSTKRGRKQSAFILASNKINPRLTLE